MKIIVLANDRGIALVDDQDYEWLSEYSWVYNRGYVQTKKDGKIILMHRLIMNAKKGHEIDHINRIPFDNQRSNLRFVTRSQNNYNKSFPQHRETRTESGYKGVYWQKNKSKWYANIRIKNKNNHLGCFSEKEDAARAYDEAAIKYYGEKAILNFPK